MHADQIRGGGGRVVEKIIWHFVDSTALVTVAMVDKAELHDAF